MKSEKTKEPILRLTKKDFRWTYFNGTGGGGQHRNKHANCVRLFHDPSGATAVSQEERDKGANERKAFERLCKTEKFQTWARVESLKKLGVMAEIEEKVERELLLNTVVETIGEDGKWAPAPEMQISGVDLERSRE